MNCTETAQDDFVILLLEGRLDSNTSEAFESELMGRIDRGNSKIVLDFSTLDYISSAGLRVLLMAAKRLQGDSSAFALCGLQDTIREVFEISGFLPILTVVDDVDAAIASLSS